MAIQTDLKNFPFDRNGGKVWYLLVEDCGLSGFYEDCFTSSSSGRRKLVEKVKSCLAADKTFKVYGVWQGEWRTDLFILPPEIILKKIQENIPVAKKKHKAPLRDAMKEGYDADCRKKGLLPSKFK
jgi:hypothetical protein